MPHSSLHGAYQGLDDSALGGRFQLIDRGRIKSSGAASTRVPLPCLPSGATASALSSLYRGNGYLRPSPPCTETKRGMGSVAGLFGTDMR